MGVLDRLLTPWSLAPVLTRLDQLEKKIMERFETVLSEIDTATTEIAAELTALRDQLAAGGLTPEQEAEVLTKLEAAATRLKGIAADPEAPVPPVEG
jgi:hypothetical protein